MILIKKSINLDIDVRIIFSFIVNSELTFIGNHLTQVILLFTQSCKLAWTSCSQSLADYIRYTVILKKPSVLCFTYSLS